jgi:hypothetical protein
MLRNHHSRTGHSGTYYVMSCCDNPPDFVHRCHSLHHFPGGGTQEIAGAPCQECMGPARLVAPPTAAIPPRLAEFDHFENPRSTTESRAEAM